jgi:hypothetical protein
VTTTILTPPPPKNGSQEDQKTRRFFFGNAAVPHRLAGALGWLGGGQQDSRSLPWFSGRRLIHCTILRSALGTEVFPKPNLLIF